MTVRLVSLLLLSAAPGALFSQEVELRSPDDFISVEGEIVGFNGVMLRVQTNVGAVSVPAAEVICFGAGCEQVVANNDFGLSADAFQDIVTLSSEQAAQTAALDETLTVGFADDDYRDLYRTLSGAYAVASNTGNLITLAGNGGLVVADQSAGRTATLNPVDDGTQTGVSIGPVSLAGTAAVAFRGADEWANAGQLPNQLLGLNAFAVVVAPTAGISEISVADLARVFAGEISNWSQIGGADMAVLPLQLPSNSRLTKEFTSLVMEPAGKSVAGNVLTMADAAGIGASINQFPGSISIVSLEDADPAVTADIVGSCGIAVGPSLFTTLSGEYPLIRPVMASFAALPQTTLATDFFDFATTDVAQSLIEDEGFISQPPILQDITEKNNRLSGLLDADLDEVQRAAAAQMFQALFEADRTSITLTGGAASGPEGAWNRAMLRDLIEVLDDPANAGREIIMAGFGQSTSGNAAAITASAAAAEDMVTTLRAVAADSIALGGFTLSSFGFGNVSPTTCYDGQVAGSEYTRIEVWLR
ncbi:MAG: substrate-binding domain-containing protein [Pseudomonadota bacterium]